MRRILGRILLLAVLVALLVVPLVSARPRHVDAPAFDFELEDINPASATSGKKLRLSELYEGRGLVVNFMASWCGPCRVELPMMQALHDQGPVPVLCVAADEDGGPRNVLPLVKAAGLTMPVLFAPEAAAAVIERHYDYQILPATYLIDADGVVRLLFEGIVEKNTLLEEIDAHLRDVPS